VRSTTTRRVPAGQALVVAVVALVGAAVVNGEDLRRTAQAQPYGPVRQVALVVTAPVDLAARSLGFGAPRRVVESATGRDPAPATSRFGSGPALERAGAPVPPSPTAQGSASPAAEATPPTTTTTTTAPPGPVRVATAEEPVRVLFAGDSLVANVAIGFGRHHQDDPRIDVDVDFRVATGLARPDVLDWPTHLVALLESFAPDVVVLLFGANDDQPLSTEHGVASLLSDAWRAEYQRRVGVMMDLARADGRHVIWLGMPAVDRASLEEARQVINHLALVEAGGRERVTFLDLASSISPEGYSAQVDGTRARDRDGVHMTINGGALAAEDIRATFAETFGL
jgi:uncharacterized protein